LEELKTLAKGRYKIVQRLGEGGMATVDLAIDARRNIPVAIKRPHESQLRFEKVVERFAQEVRTHGRVVHPNVVVMLDVGIDRLADGTRTPYMAIEYVGGMTVEACMWPTSRGGFGPLSPGIAGRILLPLLGALRVMHEGGVLHRDIKPANVMVGWDAVGHRSTVWDPNAVKLMDFGIARDTDVGPRQTGTKVVMGTDGYLAPEQLRSTKEVDHRADLYSVGAMLWAMLAGRDPNEDLHNLTIEDADFASIPDPWRTIAFGATRYKREERAYQTAEELGTAIEAALRGCADRLGPFEHWLAQKKIASPVEAALRRASGKGMTMVAEAEEPGVPSGSGHTRWFDEGDMAPNAPADALPDIAPPPKSRVRTLGVAALVAAASALVLFGIVRASVEPHPVAETSGPEVALTTPSLPTPSVGSDVPADPAPPQGRNAVPEPQTPSVGSQVSPIAKPRRPVDVPVAPATTAVDVPVAPVPVPVAPLPVPETGSVHLVKGAISIALVGSDGVSRSAGALAPGAYQIRATFSASADPVNAGSVTVLAGQDLSVSCNETMSLCKAR